MNSSHAKHTSSRMYNNSMVNYVIGFRWQAWHLLPGWQNSWGSTQDIRWVEAVDFELLTYTINMTHSNIPQVVVYGNNIGVVEGWWIGCYYNIETNAIFKHIHSLLTQTNNLQTVCTYYVPSTDNLADAPSWGCYPPNYLILLWIPILPPLTPFIINATDPFTEAEKHSGTYPSSISPYADSALWWDLS